MDNIKLNYSTFTEAAVGYLHNNMEWILKELNSCSEEQLVRIRPMEWMGDFVAMAMKKLYCPDNVGMVNGHVNVTALAVGSKIKSVATRGGLTGNLIEFIQAQKTGEWYANSSEFLMSVKLTDFTFPFIIYSVQVSISGHACDRCEIIFPKRHLDAFIAYFQNEEKSSGRIIVNVFGQKTYTIKPMEWENLTLDDSINFLIKKDLDTFMQKREWFSSKGIPYRRGYLLHGPPGNGKTTVIRAMLTQARLPAFTIKKMYDSDSMYYFEDMFEAASKTGGAFIILEDIDRSFSERGSKESEANAIPFSVFLNCLDGISDADGVIVIATANSPQILDKAILERPGRFDRVVHFPNPTPDLRRKYLHSFLPGMSVGAMATIVDQCENMSFAQLREIYIIASQIADDAGVQVNEKHMVEANERLVSYMKKAGVREAGYKTRK